MPTLQYNVKSIRATGLEARWTKTSKGQPCIVVRDPEGRSKHQRETWWTISASMWKAMQEEGARPAFDRCTLLGDLFSLPN